MPGGHCWHGLEDALHPAFGLTQPTGHSVQSLRAVAPADAPKVPGGHGVHALVVLGL